MQRNLILRMFTEVAQGDGAIFPKIVVICQLLGWARRALGPLPLFVAAGNEKA
jgi:hypothetical protein